MKDFSSAGLIARTAVAAYSGYKGYTGGSGFTGRDSKFKTKRGTFTVTLRKRKSEEVNMNGQLFSKRRHKYGRYKRITARSVNRKVAANEEKVIYRWQYVTPFGFGGGAQGLFSYQVTLPGPPPTTTEYQPLHIFDLSSYDGNPTTGPLYGGMHALGYQTATGDVQFSGPCQANDAAGNVLAFTAGRNIVERGVPPTNVDRATLKWVDLKMNLYGSYCAPIKWKIMLVRIPDESSCPVNGLQTADRPKYNWQSILRPLKYSNLLSNCGELKKSIKIVKQWNYTVQPLMKDEQTDVGSANVNISPHFIELKDFMKLDKLCKYDWHDTQVAQNYTDDKPVVNVLQNFSTDVHSTVYPTQRLFLVVACSCGTTNNTIADNPFLNKWDVISRNTRNYAASYDICLRRCFMVPKE